MFTIVKHVPVDEFLARALRNCNCIHPHLVEKQVAQTIMDKGIAIKFHRHRVMGLRAANNDRPGIRRFTEIFLLEVVHPMPVGFEILEGKYHNVAFVRQLAYPFLDPFVVTVCHAGLVFSCPDILGPRRIAAEKSKAIAMMFDKSGITRADFIFTGSIIRPIALPVHVQRKQKRVPSPIHAVIAGQLENIRADIVK